MRNHAKILHFCSAHGFQLNRPYGLSIEPVNRAKYVDFAKYSPEAVHVQVMVSEVSVMRTVQLCEEVYKVHYMSPSYPPSEIGNPFPLVNCLFHCSVLFLPQF